MRYVPDADEIARREFVLKNKILRGERIGVTFRTDRDVVAAVLPPGFDAPEDPLVTARVSRWRTNYCGSFAMAGLYVNAMVGDLAGEYILSMFIDKVDAAMVIGREDFGEPKKLADVGFFREQNRFRGTVDRLGTRLIDIDLTAGPDVGPSERNSVTLSAKAQLALGGGIDGDAQLLATYGVTTVWVDRPGEGRLTLGGNSHDPLDEFPVLEVVSAGYVESELLGGRPNEAGEYLLGTVPAAEFAPYHYGRLDDWAAHDTLLGDWEAHNHR